MIQAAYLTEDQWFALCGGIYFALCDDDLDTALELLENVGFDHDLVLPGELDAHDPN